MNPVEDLEKKINESLLSNGELAQEIIRAHEMVYSLIETTHPHYVTLLAAIELKNGFAVKASALLTHPSYAENLQSCRILQLINQDLAFLRPSENLKALYRGVERGLYDRSIVESKLQELNDRDSLYAFEFLTSGRRSNAAVDKTELYILRNGVRRKLYTSQALEQALSAYNVSA